MKDFLFIITHYNKEFWIQEYFDIYVISTIGTLFLFVVFMRRHFLHSIPPFDPCSFCKVFQKWKPAYLVVVIMQNLKSTVRLQTYVIYVYLDFHVQLNITRTKEQANISSGVSNDSLKIYIFNLGNHFDLMRQV